MSTVVVHKICVCDGFLLLLCSLHVTSMVMEKSLLPLLHQIIGNLTVMCVILLYCILLVKCAGQVHVHKSSSRKFADWFSIPK